MSVKRSAAVVTLAAMLATTGLPARAYAARYEVDVYHHAGSHAANEVGKDVGIGLAISAGVAALIGGAVWYYRHRRHAETATASTPPADVPVTTPN